MREMKDSGIEWIGQIPQDWDVVPHKRVMHKVKKICEQYSGEDIISLTMNGVIKRDLTAGGKMPTSFNGYQYVKPNDLLLCLFDIDVTPRCVGVVKDYGVTSPAYSRFVMHDGYYNAYYDYLLRAIDDDKVFVHLSKNLRSSLTESDFGAIKTCVPSLAEQKRIVTFLDAQCAEIDTVLEKTRASIEEYKKLKQAVITQAVTKGIRGDRPMKNSGIEWIGDIPAEWDYTKAKNCVNIQNGSDPKAEGSIPVYGSGASSFKTCGEYKEGPSVLIGRKGATLHIPHYISTKFWNVDTAFNVYAKPNFDLKFYFYCACSFDYRFYISQTTLPSMTQTAYENMFLPLPSNDEQRAIASYLDNRCEEIDALIWKKQECLVEIENYKKSLIYEYVTGKREV